MPTVLTLNNKAAGITLVHGLRVVELYVAFTNLLKNRKSGSKQSAADWLIDEQEIAPIRLRNAAFVNLLTDAGFTLLFRGLITPELAKALARLPKDEQDALIRTHRQSCIMQGIAFPNAVDGRYRNSVPPKLTTDPYKYLWIEKKFVELETF